jgi:hypothetical protein
VRDAIAFYDTQGTQARRRGSDKHRKDVEFITPGPDFLWCCDGHDKFRNGTFSNVKVMVTAQHKCSFKRCRTGRGIDREIWPTI